VIADHDGRLLEAAAKGLRAGPVIVAWRVADPEKASILASCVLDAIPDGWAKVDGEWFEITSDGVGYGEFDRKV
jgi:hypothetical protein